MATVVIHSVRLVLTAAGSVETFDTAAVRSHLAQIAGVQLQHVNVSVVASSVLITATIDAPAWDATNLAAQLQTDLGSAGAASDALGITVEGVPRIEATTRVVVITARPPPQPPYLPRLIDRPPNDLDAPDVNAVAIIPTNDTLSAALVLLTLTSAICVLVLALSCSGRLEATCQLGHCCWKIVCSSDKKRRHQHAKNNWAFALKHARDAAAAQSEEEAQAVRLVDGEQQSTRTADGHLAHILDELAIAPPTWTEDTRAREGVFLAEWLHPPGTEDVPHRHAPLFNRAPAPPLRGTTPHSRGALQLGRDSPPKIVPREAALSSTTKEQRARFLRSFSSGALMPQT